MNHNPVYIIAVSGGVDSVVLLHKLVSRISDDSHTQPKVHNSPSYIVAHFDHGIREDSGVDAEFVRKLAKENGLTFELGMAKLGHGASEQDARVARYRFLRQLKDKYKAQKIVTAHHQDDVLETMVINIVRGTGPRGLSPMNASDVIRPLINKTKKEIRQYADDNKLRWREDITNNDKKYLRNYIRLVIMPKLETHRQHLLDINKKISEIYEEFDLRIINEIPKKNILYRPKFLNSDFVIQKEIVRTWLIKNGVKDIDSYTIERLTIACKTLPVGKKINIKKGLWLCSEVKNILLTSK